MMATKEDDNDNENEVKEANNTKDFRHIDVVCKNAYYQSLISESYVHWNLQKRESIWRKSLRNYN